MAAQLNRDDVTEMDLNTKHVGVQSTHLLYRKFGKRLCDVVFSMCGLIICAIPMFLIAIVVRLTSPGPAIFCQLRAGRKGKLFVLYKFRSMYTSAPEKSNADFSTNERKHYVTKFGRFMRKTSIDELPQLFNVLKGEMSFIGPRPLAKTDEYVLSLRSESGADRVLPGISGLAQVNGQNTITDVTKAAWDSEYAKNCSFITDFGIVVKSLWVVTLHRNIDHD